MSIQAEFTIRYGASKDIAEIVRFNLQMAQETEDLVLNPETAQAGVRGMMKQPERGFYLVVETGPEHQSFIVAALMITTEWSDWRNGLFWWIQSVYVLPDYRRRGLYRSLYEHVQHLAGQAHDVCGFRLYVAKDNLAAQRTYHALGMVETDYQMFEQMAPQMKHRHPDV